MRCPGFPLRQVLPLVALLLAPTLAPAQTYTWAGGDPVDNNWISPLNWTASSGSPPPLNNQATTFIVMSGTTRTTNNMDYSLAAAGLTFDAAAGAFVVNSATGELLTVGASGISVASGNANPQTFNAKLALGVAQSWTNNGTGLFTAGGTVDNGGFLLTVDGSGDSLLSGILSGAGGLTKAGAGTLTLSGANTYGGGTTVNAGTLRLGSAAAVGGSGATVLLQGINPVLEAAVNTATNFGANLTVAANARFRSGRATAGVGVTHTLGTLSIGGQTLTIEPGVNVAADSAYGVTVGATTLTGSPNFVVTNNGLGTGTFTVSGAVAASTNPITVSGNGNTTISGVLTGSGLLTKSGTGTLFLTGGNTSTFTGPITVNGGGVLSYANQTSLGTAAGAGGITLDNGTLRNTVVGNAGTFSPTVRVITLGPGGGTLEWAGTATATDLIIVQTNTQITGVGGLTKTGAGIIAAVGPLTYQGPTRVAAGTLRVRTNNNSYPTTTALTVDAGATFDVGTPPSTALNQQVASLAGAGTVNLPGGTFTVGDTTSTSFTGVIQGTNGKLTKVGAGTLTLSGVNTYTGATTVSAGTLAVGTGGSLAAGSAVSVASAATLAGTGTVGGVVTVAAGGAVRGDQTGGTGTLTVANSLTLNSTATNGIFRVEAAATGPNAAAASLLSLTGAGSVLNLNPGSGNKFTINLVSNTASPLVPGDTYTLTLATVAAAGNLQLNSAALSPNGVIDPSNYALQSSSFGGFTNVSLTANLAGTGLVLTFTPVPVPEPGTVFGFAAVALAVGRVVRRRVVS